MQTFTNKIISYLLASAVALFMSTASIAQGAASAEIASPDYAAAGAGAAGGIGGLGGLGGVLGGIGLGTAVGVGLAAITVGLVVADQVTDDNDSPAPSVPGSTTTTDTSSDTTTSSTSGTN